MQYSVHNAKTQLSKLIEAALAGEEVIIARRNRPAVRLTPVNQAGFKFDILKGQTGTAPDFFEALEEDDLDAWEGKT